MSKVDWCEKQGFPVMEAAIGCEYSDDGYNPCEGCDHKSERKLTEHGEVVEKCEV